MQDLETPLRFVMGKTREKRVAFVFRALCSTEIECYRGAYGVLVGSNETRSDDDVHALLKDLTRIDPSRASFNRPAPSPGLPGSRVNPFASEQRPR